jgi:predicted RecB family nuclease
MITSELLEAYLACPMKCYLRSRGEECSENEFAALYQTQTDSYRRAGIGKLKANLAGRQIEPGIFKNAQWQFVFDQMVDADNLSADVHAIQRVSTKGGASEFIPIRLVHLNKPSRANKMAAVFDAMILSKVAEQPVGIAKIIYGDAWTTMKIRVAAQLHELKKIIGKLKVLLAAASPPDLVLNLHCAECEFRDRCRNKAIEKDDLSLLTGLTDKERVHLNRKGIFTVSQLSHTFRPRRRPKQLAAQPEKYHHSLRALALREKKIHIVGRLRLPIQGTPIFFDVESLPDRDFYYLVGIQVDEVDRRTTRHSFWANSLADERTIWTDFLAVVSAVERPILIHYGSFETRFLKKMCDRYGSPPSGSIAAEAISSSLNLLSPIFGTVYFPTYSNGLKENARFLGFEWSDTTADGHQSIVWRHLWEQSHDPELREKLIAYNMEDCAALGVVTRVLGHLSDGEPGAGDAWPLQSEIVHADAVRQRTSNWRPFKSPISDLEKINLAARWDYQRDRVFVRAGTAKRWATQQSARRPQAKRVHKAIRLDAPPACPRCQKKWRKRGRLLSRTVQDFIFGKHSIKRRMVRYEAQAYVCRSCGYEYAADLRLHGRHWGWNLLAYFVYNAIGLCIPQLTVQHSINRLFGCRLVRSSLNEFKIRASRLYVDTRTQILDRIIAGNVIHADETNANIKGQSAYVWVLTSLTEVVYILTESREGETIQHLLKGFRGVLVSDFYAAYESIECAQQKCLIHLMRDLNDEILNNPFDEEAKQVALRFAALLKPIVDTIDRRGLKAHFLRKHLREVDRFYGFLDKEEFNSDAAAKFKQRFEKNRDKLFTFLRYDGVPWNNNNAEHAIKAFARLREVISGLSTKKGVEEYLTLLSVSETCKYRGIDFLDFLRSGETDIAEYALRRRGSGGSGPPHRHVNFRSA